MEHVQIDDALERVRAALEHNAFDEAIAAIQQLRPADRADVVAELNPADQAALLPRLEPADSADILEEMEDDEAADVAGILSAEALSRIVDEMEPDEAADLLGDIPAEQAEAVLANLDEPEEVRPLLMHPDDRAGGLMTSDFLALRPRTTVAGALDAVRQWQPADHAADELYVIDQNGVLSGMVTLRQLIMADPAQPVMDIMTREVISVPAETDQEECARLFEHYDLLTLPVVDDQGRLIGVITIDDVIEVLEDEATEDIQRFGGAQPLGGRYLSVGVFRSARRRVGWLLILFAAESLTGTVLRAFEHELDAVVALAFFIPLLIDTGGNTGSQTISTVIRALAVGDIKMSDAFRVFWHEARVGLTLGLTIAAIGYARALLWNTGHGVASAVAFALLFIILWANVVGALLPFVATRLKIDPAIISGPLLTTLVDATGLLIYLYSAKLILGI